MAKAGPKSALTWVALKAVLAALEAVPDESPEGARRLVIKGCRPGGPIRWKCREPVNPRADFWCGHPSNFVFSHSDVTNVVAVIMSDELPDLVAVTLRGVWLVREDVAALRPEIGAAPAAAVPSLPAVTPARSAAPAAADRQPPTAAGFVTEDLLKNHPRKTGETDTAYAERLLRYAPKRSKPWKARTITNEFARIRRVKPGLIF
jgi:hypothetical protein